MRGGVKVGVRENVGEVRRGKGEVGVWEKVGK